MLRWDTREVMRAIRNKENKTVALTIAETIDESGKIASIKEI